MASFDPAIKMVLSHEGGYNDSTNDPGGATAFGISLRFYQQNISGKATAETIKNLSVHDANDIYYNYFWIPNRYAQIDSQKIADRIFDLAVNLGSYIANELMQDAINILNPENAIVVDGIMGQHTIDAINSLPETSLYNQLIINATDYYKNIVKHNPHLESFLNGWLHRLQN
jgi:lysozyme family protein